MTNEFLLHDDRLADSLGRPIRGLPWWMREVTQQMWLALHTGWLMIPVLDKGQRIANTIARPEIMQNWDLRLVDSLNEVDIQPREPYASIKLACMLGKIPAKSTR